MTDRYVAQALIAPKKYVHGRGHLLSSLGKYVEEPGMPFAVDAAIVAADAYGRAFRERARKGVHDSVTIDPPPSGSAAPAVRRPARAPPREPVRQTASIERGTDERPDSSGI